MSNISEYTIQASILTDIADAIRQQLGISTLITPVEMPEKIQSIENSYPDGDNIGFGGE